MKLKRESYKQIKKMNKEQLERFLDEVHVESYNQGVDDMSAIVSSKIEIGLKNTSGIGEKRYQAIMENITKALHEESVTENVEVEEDEHSK